MIVSVELIKSLEPHTVLYFFIRKLEKVCFMKQGKYLMKFKEKYLFLKKTSEKSGLIIIYSIKSKKKIFFLKN